MRYSEQWCHGLMSPDFLIVSRLQSLVGCWEPGWAGGVFKVCWACRSSWCRHSNSFSHPSWVRLCQGQPGRISLSDLSHTLLILRPSVLAVTAWGSTLCMEYWNISDKARCPDCTRPTLYSTPRLMSGLSSSFSLHSSLSLSDSTANDAKLALGLSYLL